MMVQHLFSNVFMLEISAPSWAPGCLLSEMSINYIVECLLYTVLYLAPAGPCQTLKPTNELLWV